MQWQMAGARCRGQPVRSCHASHTASHIRAAGTRSLAFYKALDSAQPATGLGRTPTRPSAEATATAAVQTDELAETPAEHGQRLADEALL